MEKEKRITLATIKAFIKKNKGQLYIQVTSELDSMTDGLRFNSEGFKKAEQGDMENELGVKGAWFVGFSRDHFRKFESVCFIGYRVSNSCGSFNLAVMKPEPTSITIEDNGKA